MKPIEKAKILWEHLANKNQHTHQGKHEAKDLQLKLECAKMQIEIRQALMRKFIFNVSKESKILNKVTQKKQDTN